VTLFTPTTGDPIDSSPLLADDGYIYLSTNNTLYKAAFPALALEGSTR